MSDKIQEEEDFEDAYLWEDEEEDGWNELEN